MKYSWIIFFKSLFWGKDIRGSFVLVVLGLAFSISIVLASLGLMDGFEKNLKGGLRKAGGDLYLYSHNGFFVENGKYREFFDDLGLSEITGVVQSEGFLVREDKSSGILLKGVRPKTYSKMTGLKINLKKNHVCIGKEIAVEHSLKVGHSVVLGLAKGNEVFEELPLLIRKKISCIVDHGIFKKDKHFIYIKREELQEYLDVGKKINWLLVNLPGSSWVKPIGIDEIKRVRDILSDQLSSEFRIKAYWEEYGSLLEAVRYEKFSIAIVLQLAVLLALMNFVGFLLFIFSRKGQDLFMFYAFGTSRSKILSGLKWATMSVISLSFVIGMLLTYLYNWLLEKNLLVKIPSDIYVIENLIISFQWKDLIFVYGVLISISYLIFHFLFKKKFNGPIISMLRREFH